MALIREMFGLSVTLVSQGCLLPLEEDPVSALIGPQLPTPAWLRPPSLPSCTCPHSGPQIDVSGRSISY